MIGITVTDDRGQRQELGFDAARIRIGREADNDVVLDSPASSRHHAEIIQELGSYKIVDLGSTNGIKVGDNKVPDLFLVDGTSVVIGVHTLTFSIAEKDTAKTVFLGPGDMPRPVAPPPPQRREPSALYLVYRQQGQRRSMKIVEGGSYVIGRSPDADLVVDDNRASKRHALVTYGEDGFQLADLASSNGTLLNGRRVAQHPLAPGDEILIGTQVIVVQDQRSDLEDDAVLLGRTRLGTPGEFDLASLAEHRPPPVDNRRERRRLGPVLFAGAVLLLLVGTFFVLRERPAEAPRAEPGASPGTPPESGGEGLIVRVAAVETKVLARSVEGSGTISPHRTVTVSAEIAGQLVNVAVDEGSAVEEGDLLAQINDTDIRLQLDEARSAVSRERVDLARENYERMQSLLEEGVLSRAVVDQAQSEYLSLDSAYRSAQARIRQLQEQLRKASIRAPISGRVAATPVNQGEFLAPGAPVAVIENMQQALVVVELSDRDIVKVRAAQAVEVTTDAYPERVFRGIVDNTATAASPVTRTFKVEARIDNGDGSLRSGMIAALRVLLDEKVAMVIPIEALVGRGETESTVFVVAGGFARRRAVVLGERWDREVEVLSGLSAGDVVITSGKDRVADGLGVQIHREG